MLLRLGRRRADDLEKIVVENTDRTIVKYSHDGADLLFEHDGTDAVQIRYLYGPGIDHILESEVTAGINQHFADALGSVARVTDDVGTVEKSMTYDSLWRGFLPEACVGNGFPTPLKKRARKPRPYGKLYRFNF